MAELSVDIVKIKEVLSHPNADRLEIIKLENLDYTVISQKGNYKPGDSAFYFPIDSVIPEKFIDEFGIRNFYNKKIRATKLRGIFSEGLLIPTHKYIDDFKKGSNWTKYFEVTKYEYPIPISMSGQILRPIKDHEYFPSPEHYKKYYTELKEGEEIVITEKLHGTNFTVRHDANEGFMIGSHNNFLKNNEENKDNIYVKTFNDNPEFKKLPIGWQIYGEIYGVQDLKYGLDKGRTKYAIFAVKVENGRILDYDDMRGYLKTEVFDMVPVLYVGPYSDDIVKKFNNATSAIFPEHIMEGIVILPIEERSSYELRRVCLKYISDSYLLRKDGT